MSEASRPAGADSPASNLDTARIIDSGIDRTFGDTQMRDLFVMKGIFAAADDLAPAELTGSMLTRDTKALTERELLDMMVDSPYMTSDEVFPHGFEDVDQATGRTMWRAPPATGLIRRIYRAADGSYCVEWIGDATDALRFVREDTVSLSMANIAVVDPVTQDVARRMLHVAVLPQGEPPAFKGSKMTDARPLLPAHCTRLAEFESARLRRTLMQASHAIRTRRRPGRGEETARVSLRGRLCAESARIGASRSGGSTVAARALSSTMAGRGNPHPPPPGVGTRGNRSGARAARGGGGGAILSLRSHTRSIPPEHTTVMAPQVPAGAATPPAHATVPPQQQEAAALVPTPTPVIPTQQQQAAPQQEEAPIMTFTESLSTTDECQDAIKQVENAMRVAMPQLSLEDATPEQAAIEAELSEQDRYTLQAMRFRWVTAKNTLQSFEAQQQQQQQPPAAAAAAPPPSTEAKTPATPDVQMSEADEVRQEIGNVLLKTIASMVTDNREEMNTEDESLMKSYQNLVRCRSFKEMVKCMPAITDARARWSASIAGPSKVIAKANPTGDLAVRKNIFDTMMQQRSFGQRRQQPQQPAAAAVSASDTAIANQIMSNNPVFSGLLGAISRLPA